MMKNYILSALALGSSVLSFLYEAPSSTASAPRYEQASLSPFEAHEAISFATAAFNEKNGTDLKKDLKPTFKDTLFYKYYGQTLGVNLEYKEDKDLLETISDWLGTPYRAGGNTQRGTDCSGFVTKVYKQVYGVTLTHSSRSLFHETKRVAKSEMETGDLVFFRRGPGKPIYHVGIYLKDGKFAHSASNGGVMVSSLNSPYYKRNFYAAGRVEDVM